MAKKFTYDQVKDFLLNKNIILLSKEYKNNKEKLLLKCECGRNFSRCFQDVKNKKMYRCEFCTGNRLSYEFVYDFIKSKGCTLLSKEYKNNATKLDIQCECGNIYSVGFETFKKGQTRCKKCYWKINKHHNLFSYDYVKKYIEENSNCKLLAKEYISIFSELDIKCGCGDIFKSKFSTIRNMKVVQCQKCSHKKASDKMRHNWNDLKMELESILKEKYEIIKCDYKNIHSKVTLKHSKCGYEFERNISNIRYGDNKCPYCENPFRRRTREEAQDLINNFSNEFIVMEYVTAGEIYLKHNECGHIFRKRLTSIKASGGIKCPDCNPLDSVGVLKIIEYLDKNNIRYIREKTFEGCYHIKKLFFDFYLPEYNACIEFDGLQHFRQSKLFGGEENFNLTKKRDSIKNEFCKNNNIYLIRIKYNQVNKINTILDNYIKQVNTEVTKDIKKSLEP